MTLLVRDEEDILDAQLRYHFAAGVDFVIATDNLSGDRTPEILRAYERDGRLRLLEERGDNYEQDAWVTKMARLAATEHGADWVINSDADEFWWPDNGSLKGLLASVPSSQKAVRAAVTNFVPRPPSEEPFFRSMTVRERASIMIGSGKPPLDKVCHRASPDVQVAQGNHAVFHRRFIHPRRVRPTPVPLTVLHFPIRSYAQLANKIGKTGAAWARSRRLRRQPNATLELRYGLLLRGQLGPHYEGLVRDDESVASGLADGELVLDERLRDKLDELYRDASSCPSPRYGSS